MGFLEGNGFVCLYCGKATPAAISSKAHIFPEAMGGVSFTADVVCKECNNAINREVENPVIEKLSFFQSIWGIRGKRSKVRLVPATLKFGGLEGQMSLDENGQPTRALVVKDASKPGTKKYSVVGPADKVEEKKSEIETKFPDVQWVEREMDMSCPPESMVTIELDLTGDKFRRLAAKVSLERFSQIRPIEILRGQEFDHVREFILDGKEIYLCCGLLSDLRLLEGPLNFPIPNHGVVIIAHPHDRILGAFVSLYGLFSYWVLLSKSYTALMPMDDLLLEHPQQKTADNPVLRQGIGSLRVKWAELIAMYEGKEKESIKVVSRYVTDKMKSAIDEFYESREGGNSC